MREYIKSAALLTLERDKRADPTTPVATDAVIARHLTYLTRIADLLSILIGLFAEDIFENLMFGGPSCAPARLHCSLYILYGDDPDQVIFVISVRGQIGASAVYAK